MCVGIISNKKLKEFLSNYKTSYKAQIFKSQLELLPSNEDLFFQLHDDINKIIVELNTKLAWRGKEYSKIEFIDNQIVKAFSAQFNTKQDMTINSNITNTTATNAYADCYTATNVTSNGSYYSDRTTVTNTNWATTTTTTAPWDTYTVYNDIGVNSKDYVKQLIDEYMDEKEKKNMNDFSFGPFNTSEIRLSLYGMAIKNKAGKWVCYDRKTKRLMDVEPFNFEIEAKRLFYKMPKATNTVVAGDIILHNGKLVFIEEVRDDGKFDVIDPAEGTAITVLPTVSPFGFNFVTSILNLADCMPAADEENPFGNLLPFLLMKDNGGDNALALAMMMQNQGKDFNPMMLALLSGGKSDLSTLMFMQMMQNKKGKKYWTGPGIPDVDE